MTIAQHRRDAALKKSNFYRALTTGTAFTFLGHLASYPGLLSSCLLILALGILTVNYQVIAQVLNQLARADRLRRAKVEQLVSVLLLNASVPFTLFLVGGLL